MNTDTKNFAKVTPGGWEHRMETDGRHTVHYIKVGKANIYSNVIDGLPYAVRGVGMTEEEMRANFRLVEHAPAILAERDRLRSALQNLYDQSVDNIPLHDDAWLEAQAALAATGKGNS